MQGISVSIPPVATSGERPFVSVMIPTWRPRSEYLEGAIRSVLGQTEAVPGVQIEIVDDCSTDFDPYGFVRRFESAAVAVYRHDRHVGLAANWNTCLMRARGRWIHLLHQDDVVLPGFYEALCAGIRQEPEAAAAFSACYFCNESGDRWAPRLISIRNPGILNDWMSHVFERLSIQCSSIIVRRDVYETLGGFDPSFRYAVDWDMWKRIVIRYPVWYHPEPLACYRMHPDSETARQRKDGNHLKEIFRSIDQSAELLAPDVAGRVKRHARFHYAVFSVENAVGVVRSAHAWTTAIQYLRIAAENSSAAIVIAALIKVGVRGVARILKKSAGAGHVR